MSKMVKIWEVGLTLAEVKKAVTLVSEKERRLNGIGFIWIPCEAKWDTMIRVLTQFKQREGHCNVSDQHFEYLLDGAVKDKLGA